MTGGCWLPNIQSRLACQGIVSPLSLHLLTFLSSWQEPTVAVSVWQVHLRSSIPRARASSYGPTLCQVTEELKLIVLLWTECSEPLALERVFSSSLGWKGDANIPSHLIPSNSAQGLGENKLKQGSVQHLPRKNHVGELETQRAGDTAWSSVTVLAGTMALALPSERSISCCASPVKSFHWGFLTLQ